MIILSPNLVFRGVVLNIVEPEREKVTFSFSQHGVVCLVPEKFHFLYCSYTSMLQVHVDTEFCVPERTVSPDDCEPTLLSTGSKIRPLSTLSANTPRQISVFNHNDKNSHTFSRVSPPYNMILKHPSTPMTVMTKILAQNRLGDDDRAEAAAPPPLPPLPSQNQPQHYGYFYQPQMHHHAPQQQHCTPCNFTPE